LCQLRPDKAFANLVSRQLANNQGRKRIHVLGWLGLAAG
jgi:hypothetical protein